MSPVREPASWPVSSRPWQVSIRQRQNGGPHAGPVDAEGGVDLRSRDRVLQSLEKAYVDAFKAAEAAGDSGRMGELDLEYQRDQLRLEVLLDIRELLAPEAEDKTASLLEKAQNLRKLTKLR